MIHVFFFLSFFSDGKLKTKSWQKKLFTYPFCISFCALIQRQELQLSTAVYWSKRKTSEQKRLEPFQECKCWNQLTYEVIFDRLQTRWSSYCSTHLWTGTWVYKKLHNRKISWNRCFVPSNCELCSSCDKCPDWLCGQDKLQHETTDSFEFCA